MGTFHLQLSYAHQEHYSTLSLFETDPRIESYDIMFNPNPDPALMAKHKQE